MSWYRAQVCEPAAVQTFLDQVQRGARAVQVGAEGESLAQVLAEPVSFGLVFYFNEVARSSILFLRYTLAEECEPPSPEGKRTIL